MWTQLNLTKVKKTRTYIQRSQSASLELCLDGQRVINDAFVLVIPHISRLKYVTIYTHALPSALRHFRCPTPLLEKLDIQISSTIDEVVLDGGLFRDTSRPYVNYS